MLKIKKTINFKMLREKGPNCIDIKKDEVVQIVSTKKEILYVVTQEYLMELVSAHNSLLIHSGLKKEQIVEINFNEKLKEIQDRAKKISEIAKDDD